MFSKIIGTLSIATILFVVRKLRERKWGKCRNTVQLDGKVVIITGANSGLGYVVAKHLTARNARVILACRRLQAARVAAKKIAIDLGKKYEPNLICIELDLSSLESIEKFAKTIQSSYDKIHILINNAGVAYPKKQIHYTADNLEIHMGINHLGHFHLTNLLLPTLKQTEGSRIVVVSSSLHERGDISNINPDNLLTTGRDFYSNSKLANVYFARELASREQQVDIYALCPGWVYTNLFRHSLKWWHFILISPIAYLFMRTPHQGSQTILYCATEPSIQSGLLYRDCAEYKSKVEFDKKIGSKLWQISEDVIKRKIE